MEFIWYSRCEPSVRVEVNQAINYKRTYNFLGYPTPGREFPSFKKSHFKKMCSAQFSSRQYNKKKSIIAKGIQILQIEYKSLEGDGEGEEEEEEKETDDRVRNGACACARVTIKAYEKERSFLLYP